MTKHAEGLTAAVYARISEDRDGTGLGVARQEKDCKALAARRGWHVARVYVDNDISAYSGKARPQYRQMLGDIKAGTIRGVVVWHLDRLHRQPRELEEFIDICNAYNVALASVTGEVDLATSEGRLFARIQGAVANKSSEDMSRRIQRKHLELAEAGKLINGGARAFGYSKDGMSVIPEEAEVIREAARRALAGDSLRSLVADFHARGIKGSSGRFMSSATIRTMLQSARISGQREHHGKIVAKGEWPGIITPEETAKLRALFGDPKRRSNHGGRGGYTYLLTGLVRCGVCGQPLRARPKKPGDRRYACIKDVSNDRLGCGSIRRRADGVEALVVAAVLAAFDGSDVARLLEGDGTDNTAELLAEVAREEEQLRELADAYGRRQVTMSEWLAARRPIEERVATLSAQLQTADRKAAAATEYAGNADALRRDWPTLSLDRQRAIIATVVDHVVVEPIAPDARGLRHFDPSKVRIVWRF